MNYSHIEFLSDLVAYIVKNDRKFATSRYLSEIDNIGFNENSDNRVAKLNMIVGSYGDYFMQSLLSAYESQKIIPPELSKSLTVICEVFQKFYADDKWNVLHEGIIMCLYPDHYNRFDKQDWIRNNLDYKTSELVRKFYLLC